MADQKTEEHFGAAAAASKEQRMRSTSGTDSREAATHVPDEPPVGGEPVALGRARPERSKLT